MELTKIFLKFCTYKLNVQNPIVFLYANNKELKNYGIIKKDKFCNSVI